MKIITIILHWGWRNLGGKKGLQAENKVVHPAMVVHLHQHWASVAEHVVHHWEHRCLCLRVVVIMVEL